jgi:hypothetical protein
MSESDFSRKWDVTYVWIDSYDIDGTLTHTWLEEVRVTRKETTADGAQHVGADADGFLTKEEAIAHWRNGGGTTLNIDLSKLDLSGVYASDFRGGIGSKLVVNFAFQANLYDNIFKTKLYHQGWVLGNITLKLVGPNEVRAYQDTYDFDYKSNGNPLNWPRNVDTVYGEHFNGAGTAFKININGSAFIDSKPFPIR